MQEDSASAAMVRLVDPNLDQATLLDIAQRHPELRQAVVAHRNCYPALAAWIRQQQQPAPTPPAPTLVNDMSVATQFRPYAETQATPTRQPWGSAPPVGGSAQAASLVYPPQLRAPSTMAHWASWAMAGWGVVMFITVFMPVVSVAGIIGFTYFGLAGIANNITEAGYQYQDDSTTQLLVGIRAVEAIGIAIIVVSLVVLAVALAAAATGDPSSQTASAIVGLIAGAAAVIWAVIMLAKTAGTPGFGPGSGLVLFLVTGILMVITAIVMLVPSQPAPVVASALVPAGPANYPGTWRYPGQRT